MAQFVVRHLEDAVAEKLKQRAKRHARSMEDEVRHILRAAVRERPGGVQKLGTRIARRFQRAGLTSDLPELRGPHLPTSRQIRRLRVRSRTRKTSARPFDATSEPRSRDAVDRLDCLNGHPSRFLRRRAHPSQGGR